MGYRFDSAPVDIILQRYKLNKNEDTLNDLYSILNPIIKTVTKRISKTFSRKYPEDFEDLQQQVYLSIFKILDKIATTSIDGEQLVRITVSAIIFSFKTAYRKYKKVTPVRFSGTFYNTSTFQTDTGAPIFFDIEEALGSEEPAPGGVVDHIIRARIKVAPVQDDAVLLSQFKARVLSQVYVYNRYKENVPIIDFCLDAVMNGRSPSAIVISRFWSVSNASFWPKYTNLLLKKSFLSVYKEMR